MKAVLISMGGDRFYCKCPVCGAECKTRTKEETQR